jgi:dUTP pyrophosphatase
MLPSKSTAHAAGYDLYAWTPYEDNSSDRASLVVAPGGKAIVKTGLNIRIPAGYEVQIRPRSGLAAKHAITVLNTPGTIDADYDGDGEKFEIGVILINHGTEPFAVNHGDRIAQMVVCKLPDVDLVEDYEDNALRNESQRAGGFGHTGV